ncbi:MAG TPA: SGNH/GDSL hydrolase family protein [Ohtaekwangia sp.]|nr:SGNH/GDSL hydrolase family protein [Ohtaekwangia sp.]
MKFLALGDSYTIGESVDETQRWPVLLTNHLKTKGIACETPTIIAKTGWRTDELKEAVLEANLSSDYDLVSLLIGVNNQYQGKSAASYEPEFEELLQLAIQLGGGQKAHVIVISIPDYGYTPFGRHNQTPISKGIDAFNDVNKRIAEKYSIVYIDITDISQEGLSDPKLIATDGLHPSGKMYQRWVDRIKNFIDIKGH